MDAPGNKTASTTVKPIDGDVSPIPDQFECYNVTQDPLEMTNLDDEQRPRRRVLDRTTRIHPLDAGAQEDARPAAWAQSPVCPSTTEAETLQRAPVRDALERSTHDERDDACDIGER